MEEEGIAVCSAIGYNEYDHVQVSVSVKTYPCPHCTKSFSKSATLRDIFVAILERRHTSVPIVLSHSQTQAA